MQHALKRKKWWESEKELQILPIQDGGEDPGLRCCQAVAMSR